MQDKRKLKGQKTRKRILEAAKKVIEKEGFRAVSTRRIAQLAGISQSSLYHHFATSDEIIMASLVHRAQGNLSTLDLNSYDDLAVFMTDLFALSLKSATGTDGSNYFALMDKARTDENFGQMMIDFAKRMNDWMKEGIIHIHGRPIPSDKLEPILFSFTLMREGLINHLQLFGDQTPYKEPVQIAAKVFQLFVASLED